MNSAEGVCADIELRDRIPGDSSTRRRRPGTAGSKASSWIELVVVASELTEGADQVPGPAGHSTGPGPRSGRRVHRQPDHARQRRAVRRRVEQRHAHEPRRVPHRRSRPHHHAQPFRPRASDDRHGTPCNSRSPTARRSSRAMPESSRRSPACSCTSHRRSRSCPAPAFPTSASTTTPSPRNPSPTAPEDDPLSTTNQRS
jgi:hypothetical protein